MRPRLASLPLYLVASVVLHQNVKHGANFLGPPYHYTANFLQNDKFCEKLETCHFNFN